MAGVCQMWQARTDQRNMVAAGNASAISILVKPLLGFAARESADPVRSIAYLKVTLNDFLLNQMREYSKCPRMAMWCSLEDYT